MSEHNKQTQRDMNPDTDELLKLYKAAAADDTLAPSPRVRSAALMYARTLADHRNAFPGSVAHSSPDEEIELASVPRDKATLDPQPLPVKPLHADDDEAQRWPRDLPPVAAPSAWLSLGKWVATALAGGLALGASYSWFNATRAPQTAPEPMIAQAPASPPKPAAPLPEAAPPQVAAADIAASAPVMVAKAEQAAELKEAASSEAAKARPQVATATAKPAAATKPPVALAAKTDKPRAKESQTRELLERDQKLARNSTSNNPPLQVADANPINEPQVNARALAKNAAASNEEQAYAGAPAVAAAPAAAPSVMASPQAAAAPQAATAATAGKDARFTGALARPEHEADPAKWMSYIADLRNRGRSREADIELVRLRERYPQFFNTTKPAAPTSAPAQ